MDVWLAFMLGVVCGLAVGSVVAVLAISIMRQGRD